MRWLTTIPLFAPLIAVLGAGLPALAQEEGQEGALREPVAVELCLAVDGSGSIAEDEFWFQRQAYAQALADDRVLATIRDGAFGAIAVALMEWGGPHSLHPIVEWTSIRSKADAEAFGEKLMSRPRMAQGWNSISNAIAFCADWMADNDFTGLRQVIDVSGDSGQRGGLPLPLVRQRAAEAGITVNGLALDYRGGGMSGPAGMDLRTYYEREVIVGAGAFALSVTAQEEFVEALVRKFVLELAEAP